MQIKATEQERALKRGYTYSVHRRGATFSIELDALAVLVSIERASLHKPRNIGALRRHKNILYCIWYPR